MSVTHLHTPAASPFDAIRQTRPDGSEFWSARDLMPLLGYDKWERFSDATDRAIAAAEAQGYERTDHFPGAGKKVPIGSGATREVTDWHLTRFAAYLVAMNGDPRKPEVAAAQAYFAIRTREAETRPAPALPQSYAEALRELAATVEAKAIAEQRAAELEVPAAAWDHLASADGDYSVGDAAKVLARAGIATGQNRLFQRLDALGWIFRRSGHWTAMQTAVESGLVRERLRPPRYDQVTGAQVAVEPQIRLTAKGVERLRTALAT